MNEAILADILTMYDVGQPLIAISQKYNITTHRLISIIYWCKISSKLHQ